jgi:hypothetical protein
MFRPTRPSSGVLKFGGNCCAFRATTVGVFVSTMFLNEVSVVSPSMPHVLPFLGTSVVYGMCSMNAVSVLWNWFCFM